MYGLTWVTLLNNRMAGEWRKIMSKVAVVFWSQTGNTEALANAVAEGAKSAGAEVSVLGFGDINSSNIASYDAIAFGCPAMGAEQLEEIEVDPVFTELESSLSGKKIALFGSYGWGSGEWMEEWENRAKTAGANLAGASVICNEAPDDDALANAKKLGETLAA